MGVEIVGTAERLLTVKVTGMAIRAHAWITSKS